MRTIIILISLICFTAIPSFAGSGLQAGNTVTWKKGNEIFFGRLVDSNMEKKEVTVITPSWSYTETNYRLYEFQTIDGKTILGAVYMNPVFDVDTGTTGMQKNIWIEHIDFIETE